MLSSYIEIWKVFLWCILAAILTINSTQTVWHLRLCFVALKSICLLLLCKGHKNLVLEASANQKWWRGLNLNMSSPRQGSGDIWKKSSTIAPMTLKTSLLTIFIYTSQSFIEVICYGEKKIKLDHKNYTDYYFDKIAGI